MKDFTDKIMNNNLVRPIPTRIQTPEEAQQIINKIHCVKRSYSYNKIDSENIVINTQVSDGSKDIDKNVKWYYRIHKFILNGFTDFYYYVINVFN
jgi:hypothetical protein